MSLRYNFFDIPVNAKEYIHKLHKANVGEVEIEFTGEDGFKFGSPHGILKIIGKYSAVTQQGEEIKFKDKVASLDGLLKFHADKQAAEFKKAVSARLELFKQYGLNVKLTDPEQAKIFSVYEKKESKVVNSKEDIEKLSVGDILYVKTNGEKKLALYDGKNDGEHVFIVRGKKADEEAIFRWGVSGEHLSFKDGCVMIDDALSKSFQVYDSSTRSGTIREQGLEIEELLDEGGI